MSLALYSCKSKEAYKLRSNDIEISINEDEQINFENTNDPEKMVQFNCIYNKDEITTLLGTQGFTPEQFVELPISGGYKLYHFNDENFNTISNEGYCATYKKLFELLNTSTKNLNSLLNKLGSNIKFLQNASLTIIGSDETKDVSIYKNLISALNINNENISGVINHIYEIISSIDSFSVDEFLKTILQKDEEMTSIILNTETNNYISTQVSITKYKELVSELEKLTIVLTQILIVEPTNDLTYIEETKTKKEGPDELSNDSNQYIYTYSTKSKHVDTFTELINQLSISTSNIEKWVTKIEQIKTSGIDPNSKCSLNDLKYIDTTNSIKTIKPNTLNNLITKLSENNNNLHTWLSSKESSDSDFNEYIKNLNDMELLVCMKKGDEYVFQKLKVHKNDKSTTTPTDAIIESSIEGQFVDETNNVILDLNNLADIQELEKNNVAVNMSLIESINVVFDTYKTLGIVIKHTFQLLNSCVLSPSTHFVINTSKFLWNNYIYPSIRYGVDQYGRLKKYVINFGDDNEFIPTNVEDDSYILKYLKNKVIATEEIAINTWNDLYDFFRDATSEFYVVFGSMFLTIAILSQDCTAPNARALEEDDELDNLEEIFEPNKYSIVDVIYKLKNKLYNHIKNHPSSSGSSSSSDSNFTVKNGFSAYDIKVKDLYNTTMIINEKNYNILQINISNEFSEITEKTNIFKIILRNNILYDVDGNLMKEFFIYIKNQHIYNPVISRTETNSYNVVNQSEENKFYIAFETINPYDLYISGELSIQYLLSQDSLISNKPTIKCDIIEAENALKLYKNDNLYLYLPDIITEETLEIEAPNSNKVEKEFYKIIYKIPTDYVIPINMKFIFKEFCFGNEWDLIWNGSKWVENNCKGLIRGKVSSKLRKVNTKQNSDGAIGCFILIKDTKTHHSIIPENENGLLYSLIENSNIDTTIYYTHKDESYDGALYDVEWYFDKKLNGAKCDGYDMLNIYFTFGNLSSGKFNYLNIKKIELTITLKGSSISNTLSFESTGVRRTTKNDRAYIDLVPIIDTIEQLAYKWEYSNIKSRDIELYLRKDLVDPIEEINWDPNTNPFQYIIRNQFYEITPRPDAASTLYTDFNITSSKIITADNITTMRSDLNVVSNNYDVMNYDVSKIRKEVNTLNTQMAIQIMKTQYLEQAVNSIQVSNAIKLAFSTPMAVLGAIGLAVSAVGVDFGVHTIYNGNDVTNLNEEQLQLNYPDADTSNIQNVDAGEINQVVGSIGAEPDLLNSYWNQYRDLVMDLDMWDGNEEMCDQIFNQLNELVQTIDREFPGAELPPWVSVIVHAPDVRLLSVETNTVTDQQILNTLMKWCEKEYKRLDDPTKFKDNFYNPDKAVLSLSATIDICNRMRDSMKLPIMILAKNIEALNKVNMNEYYKKSEVDELIKTYENRISALEKKCANIE
ncbi:hypothetical protein M9Y10_020179 [Tritrichomonas musculus]|uniref:Uncharacterized protein n=1 Tax=Tritrichomonas musculus TaxID=1915356 RepID=A0ABR2GKJ7_9EUKA